MTFEQYVKEEREEAREEGRQEGLREGYNTIICRMLQENVSVEEISRLTGIPKEQILELKEDNSI